MRSNDLKMRKNSHFKFWRKRKPHQDPTAAGTPTAEAADWSTSRRSTVPDTADAARTDDEQEGNGRLLLEIPEQIADAAHFSLRECVFAIVAYLSVGAIAYTRIFERWSLVDALYFSVASFSTVGKHTHVWSAATLPQS